MNPWDQERRERLAAKIRKEADRAAARIGAEGVVMVAFFPDGEHFHVLDGGKSPMPFLDLYKMLVTVTEAQEGSPGKDVGYVQ